MFKNKENYIQLTKKEKLILTRSLEMYGDELLKAMDKNEVHNSKLLYVSANDYFNSIYNLENKIKKLK